VRLSERKGGGALSILFPRSSVLVMQEVSDGPAPRGTWKIYKTCHAKVSEKNSSQKMAPRRGSLGFLPP
jgi:hypothetical protein